MSILGQIELQTDLPALDAVIEAARGDMTWHSRWRPSAPLARDSLLRSFAISQKGPVSSDSSANLLSQGAMDRKSSTDQIAAALQGVSGDRLRGEIVMITTVVEQLDSLLGRSS